MLVIHLSIIWSRLAKDRRGSCTAYGVGQGKDTDLIYRSIFDCDLPPLLAELADRNRLGHGTLFLNRGLSFGVQNKSHRERIEAVVASLLFPTDFLVF